MDHTYMRCTRDWNKGITCTGCRDDGLDCKYDSLSICEVCGGMEGSLLPTCPGRLLTLEEDQLNYQHYCNKTGPFTEHDEFCESERAEIK